MNRKPCWLNLLLAAAFGVSSLMAADSKSSQQAKSFKQTITRRVTANYLLHLPAGYSAKARKRWPLILFLHGAGERGTDPWLVARHGPPKLVKDRPDFPFIVVSPQCPAGKTWDNDTLLALLDQMIDKHRVDTNRVYLTGLSMGGFGSWSLALDHPERFAAVVPICGGGEPIDLLLADARKTKALRALPIWAFHGAKDSVVPLAESERMIDALRKFGCKDAKLTVYSDADHDSWTQTYNNQDLYDWLLQHSR